MKVEKAFTINGNVVAEVFRKGDFTVYEYESGVSDMTLYFVNNKTETVMFQQYIEADMGQGTGYISNILFQGVN